MKIRELLEGLEFRGYPCTYDCSGHQAGHEYATRWGLEPEECPYGNSNSFWEGCKSRGEEEQDLEEDLDEMAGKIHGGIRKALMDKGYKYLGGGIDKQAYLEPNGQVFIVFGYRQGTLFDFSPDQKMFVNWINYCNKNRGNPHLPRFSGFESFEFQGRKYIQARMEALQELPDEVGFLIGNVSDAVWKLGKGDYDRAFKNIAQWGTDSSLEQDRIEYYDVKRAIKLLGGLKSAKDLLKTVDILKQFALKHNFSIDLHRGNYMQRPDGTIVVNDPFVIWERNL